MDAKEKQTGSPGERLLWDVFGHSHAFELVSSALAVLRVEGPEDDADLESLLQEALATEVARLRQILDAEQGENPRPSRFSGELVALVLFASHQPLALPPLYEAYSRRELLEAQLWLFLAAQAARNGEVDIDSRLARFADLLDRLASEAPPLPSGPAAPYRDR